VVLIAERAALLAGRVDEFVAVVTLGFTGIRWGELVGLETQYVRPASVRVAWQLYELDNGRPDPARPAAFAQDAHGRAGCSAETHGRAYGA